jgi:hypothetical protein
MVSLNSTIFGPAFGRLFVGVDEGRGDQFDFLTRQLQIVRRSRHGRCGHHQRCDSGAH